MDDRRHRLFNMQPGDTAQFSTQGRKQQFHMNTDGGFWLGPRDKTLRMGLLDEDSVSDQQQQQGAQQTGVSARDGSSGGSTGGGSSGQQQKGQQPRYKDQQNTFRFVDVNKQTTRISGTEAHMMLSDGDSYVHCINQKTYLGGNQSKHSFAPVETTQGPSVNVYARIGSLAAGEEAVIIGDAAAANASTHLLPVVLALLLGISLGVNYAVWPAVMTSVVELASR
jgi:hypothetical protein